jgi:hypothetical protein
MSDEEGLVNVEDDTPAEASAEAPPAAAPAAPAVAEPVVQPAAEDTPAEVESVEVAGKKYVPVGALIGERKQRQALQDRAAKADELEAYVRDARPYVEFLKNNPDLLKPRTAPAPAAPHEPATDPRAEQLAKTLDLYTTDGKPDLARANTLQTLITQTAQAIADKAIGPVQERNAQDQSARNFQIALTVKDADGRSPSQEALTQIWRTMPAHQTADPNVASILALTALGLDRVSRKAAPAPPAHAPIVTESPGGPARRPSLSALETKIARDRGISDSKWQELTVGHVPGRAAQLED